MERLEAARGAVNVVLKRLDATKQRAREMNTDLDTRLGNATAQIDKLLAERAPCLVGVPAEAIRRYDRLRASPARINSADRRALVAVRDGVCCDRCRMNLTAQTRMNVRKGQPVACENCGTMLYHDE
jgi:predicted  nucleic acid-binding Zn-ribbon protein